MVRAGLALDDERSHNEPMEDRHPCLSRPMGILPVDNHNYDKLEACRPSQAGSLTSGHSCFVISPNTSFRCGVMEEDYSTLPAIDRTLSSMQADLDRVLFDEATILRRLDELARQISADYRDRELTVIAILNGSLMFMADLLRRIPLPLRLDCLSVASYHGGLQTGGEVIFRQIAQPDVAGRDILLLDDILDSGTTISAIREKLQTASPKSIRVCVLLRKIKERARPIEADYVGFDIADEFVVGYGLDYGEGYRNLACIGVLKKEFMA
jgi:hypoxanthine phosphoribosyltransferase